MQSKSIDEFKGNAGGEKFQCNLSDPVKHKIIDILPNRDSEDLCKHFLEYTYDERAKVKKVVMDLSTLFRSVAKKLFPEAKIIADKFHVIRVVINSLENVRKRIQKEFHDTKRKWFKRSRQLLLKPEYKLTDEDKIELNRMLNSSRELEQSGCYYGAPTGTMITSDRNGRQMLIMSMMLDNNMQFFIRVPKAEVTAPKQKLITLLLLNAGVFLIISAVIVQRWAAKFTRPLLELTEKAQKIADNKLETELSCKTGDEVEVLSESLAKMVGSLKGHIDYINGLAYIEPMTRLGNNLAYKKKLEELSADIAEGKAGPFR